mgnify:CR=1 FL=1
MTSMDAVFRSSIFSPKAKPVKISIGRDHPQFDSIKRLISRLATHHMTSSGLQVETPQVDPDENIKEFLNGCADVAEELGIDIEDVLATLSARKVDPRELLHEKNLGTLGQLIETAVSGAAKGGLTPAARVRYANIAEDMKRERHAK